MILTKSYKHDDMHLAVNLDSGGSFKFLVDRTGETLSVCFSNDEEELEHQVEVFKKYMKFRTLESNAGRFLRLERLITVQGGCKTGRQVIRRMEFEMNVFKTEG